MPPGIMTDKRDRFGALVQPSNKGSGTAPYGWFEYERSFQGLTTVKLLDGLEAAA